MAWAGDALSAFMARYGYRRVDTPLLEETELLLRKSGGELASKMYTFTDPGSHRVSLRPEFTSSVVRAYLQGMNGGPLPIRWSYLGPIFRYEPGDVEYRQFIQAGAEIIGATGPWADAEVLAMACKGLSHLGISRHRLVVGHLGFIGALLESMGISDRARLFLLANVTPLSRGAEGLNEVRQRARGLGLLTDVNTQNDVPAEAAMALLDQYLQTSPSPTIGVRTPQEIRERFLRKQQASHNADRLDQALETLSKVVQISGDPDKALNNVRRRVDSTQALEEVDRLAETLAALSHYHLDMPVTVDFGLARGIAYYTGIVFEIQHPAVEGASLGGGGRYDGLMQALGGPDPTPAMGFAWSLERVVGAVMKEQGSPAVSKPQPEVLLVRPEKESAMAAALLETERLRTQGKIVELELNARSLDECLLQAQERGVSQVITVKSEGEVQYEDVPGRR